MRIPLFADELAGLSRSEEPVTQGIPLPRGEVHDPSLLVLLDEQQKRRPGQFTPLARWSDGSIKWILIDTMVSLAAGKRRQLVLSDENSEPAVDDKPGAGALSWSASPQQIEVTAGRLQTMVSRDGSALLDILARDDVPSLLCQPAVTLNAEDDQGRPLDCQIRRSNVVETGPVRCTVELGGTLSDVLEFTAWLSLWAGRELVRLELQVVNPAPAVHQGGTWDLGDKGSVLLRSLTVDAQLQPQERRPSLSWTVGPGDALEGDHGFPFQIYQDSSGGPWWNAPTHANRHNRVPCSFRGYRGYQGSKEIAGGNRAQPSLWLSGKGSQLGGTLPEFWQNFPKALEADDKALRFGLWPRQFGDVHEIQGGEQKTHVLWLSLEGAGDLAWCQQPLRLQAEPQHYVETGVFPNLIAWTHDDNEELTALAAAALCPEQGFRQRREVIDEYGWRNYGDLYADHENIGNEGPEPRISHYNNQYDPCLATLAQYARSGDVGWLEIADPLARHVADIDVYHTAQDRAAYNGGLFWHTDHYTDAQTSSHRCYSRHAPQAQEGGGYGGGPSAEHNYATGLATHYFMTGWRPSRQAALSLADWVIDMDDERLTPLGSLSPTSTGLASRTIDHTYHGPGRGVGNSIEALLDGFTLTGNERYLDFAERLVHRSVDPRDDFDRLGLFEDPENRWSYAVCLMALIRFLETKAELGAYDEAYDYGRSTLLHYARAMAERETPSADRRDRLLIWTETWPAQDLRKGLVLLAAASYASTDEEGQRFWQRGEEICRAAQTELCRWETRTLTRPLILVLRYGYQWSALRQAGPGRTKVPREVVEKTSVLPQGKHRPFVPWKGRVQLLMDEVRTSGPVMGLFRAIKAAVRPE
jgi:hypothetical protein